MEKSSSQKALKIICIIWIILAAIAIVIGIASMAIGGAALYAVGSDAVASADVDAAAVGGVLVAMLGIGAIIEGIIDIIISIFGIRGANNPKKIGVFFVLCIIGLVLGVISLIASLTSGGNIEVMSVISSVITSLLWPIVCLVLANNIKKQNA